MTRQKDCDTENNMLIPLLPSPLDPLPQKERDQGVRACAA